jgi:tetratricopeptide (TPR) repeat protein
MGFFDRLRKSAAAEPKPVPDVVQKTTPLWDKGYKIQNRYEIIDIKKGGMGIVYIAHDHEWDRIFAIKTFQDQYLWDEDIIQRFMAEAQTWTELERHTNIVFANFIQRIEGKPLLFLEYINGGDINPFVGNLTIEETLDFAIQFCTGMEYAYQKLGVIHRDIKPGNVMVQKDPRFKSGYAFKITDFGLVKVLGDKFLDEFVEISTGMGTLPFMPPEQFPERIQEKFSFKGQVTTRSDIHSFGATLYLLLTGKMPFIDLNEIFIKQPVSPKNLNPKIPELMDKLIIKCLEKNPDKRYTDFTELKEKLVEISNDFTHESYAIVGEKEKLTYSDWSNKGFALDELGKFPEAIECYDKSLEINPRYDLAWNNKGLALADLGNLPEAIGCYDRALEINPRYGNALKNKGNALKNLGKLLEAIGCCDKVLEINPRDDGAWDNKGNALRELEKFPEAIVCYDKSLEINPRYFEAWNNKGLTLADLGKFPEAIECYDKALEINPRYDRAWNNKGVALGNLGNSHNAIGCCDKALEINPRFFEAWNNKGIALKNLGKFPEAIECYERFMEFAPPEYASHVEKIKQIINQLK